MKHLVLLPALALSGCMALAPNTVRPEIAHYSHATQHEPFTSNPTNYGSEVASVILHWDLPKQFSLELGEGYDLDKPWKAGNHTVIAGEMAGPREEFTARVGYAFKIH